MIIEFKGLKKQKKYGDINITIFGSQKKQNESTESNNDQNNNDDPGAPPIEIDQNQPIIIGPGVRP